MHIALHGAGRSRRPGCQKARGRWTAEILEIGQPRSRQLRRAGLLQPPSTWSTVLQLAIKNLEYSVDVFGVFSRGARLVGADICQDGDQKSDHSCQIRGEAEAAQAQQRHHQEEGGSQGDQTAREAGPQGPCEARGCQGARNGMGARAPRLLRPASASALNANALVCPLQAKKATTAVEEVPKRKSRAVAAKKEEPAKIEAGEPAAAEAAPSKKTAKAPAKAKKAKTAAEPAKAPTKATETKAKAPAKAAETKTKAPAKASASKAAKPKAEKPKAPAKTEKAKTPAKTEKPTTRRTSAAKKPSPTEKPKLSIPVKKAIVKQRAASLKSRAAKKTDTPQVSSVVMGQI